MQRRYFLMNAGLAVTAGTPATAAGEKVNVALMGLRGRGLTMARWFGGLADVNIPVVCDVDSNVVGPAIKIVTEAKGKQPQLVSDIRRVLDDKSIDAVIMATPIHWHAAGTILACDAGKDVYVEKPASHNVREGRLMVEAARRNKRIVQVGTQSRSRPVTQRFVDLVQSGKLGRVSMIKVMNCQMRKNIGHLPDEPAPAGLDFDTWTGPVPKLPFNRNRFHGTVNWNWHYGGGDLLNDSVHFIDVARWALGVDYPTDVSGMGRKLFFDDDQQTPDHMSLTFNYKDKVISYEHRLWVPYRLEGSENTVAAYGTEGMALMGRWQGGHWEVRVFDSKGAMVSSDREPEADQNSHARNFIDCIRSRKTPNADVETGHISTAVCHLGNIVARINRNVRFDGAAERILDDGEASKLLARDYRSHWSTPKGVHTA